MSQKELWRRKQTAQRTHELSEPLFLSASSQKNLPTRGVRFTAKPTLESCQEIAEKLVVTLTVITLTVKKLVCVGCLQGVLQDLSWCCHAAFLQNHRVRCLLCIVQKCFLSISSVCMMGAGVLGGVSLTYPPKCFRLFSLVLL